MRISVHTASAPDGEAVAEGELGIHTPVAIHTPEVDVDLTLMWCRGSACGWATGVSLDVFLAGFTKEMPPAALNEFDLSELPAALRAGEMTDTVRTSLQWVLQQLIEAEATAVIGARPHERTDSRVTQRSGHRPKLVSTAVGDAVRSSTE